MAGRSTCILAAALTTLLGACTLEPHYHRPPSPVPAIQGGTAGGTAAADIGWREFFPDPQLQQLIALALSDNRDLRVAALNVLSAQAQYRIQRAQLFPTVDASAVEQVQRIPLGVLEGQIPPGALGGGAGTGTAISLPSGITTHTYDVGVGFTSYELDLFGRIRSLSHAALQQYFSTGETRRSVQLTLVAEVATAYVTVLADQTLLDITRDTLKSQRESYALTHRMFSGGTTTELALRQAETTVDTAQANLAQYDRQLAQDKDALALLLGAPIPEGIDFSAGLNRPNVIAELEEGIPSDVLVRRPDVLAAEHQLMAANAQIGAARAAFLPAISLTGNFGTESTQLSGLFKGGSQAWAFSPQISVPIFAGGANLANLQATKLARDTAVAQYEKAIQTAFREVADALALTDTLERQREAQEALVSATGRAYNLSQQLYKAGRSSYLDVLDSQRSYYSAQQTLIATELAQQDNRVTLYKALGGGWRERSP